MMRAIIVIALLSLFYSPSFAQDVHNPQTDASKLTTGTLPPARLGGLNSISNVLSGDVSLSNTGQYFDGPTIAQGSTGTWYVCGSIVVTDTAGPANISAKLWDGTTTIASGFANVQGANSGMTLSLCGYIASPAGNLRISALDGTSTSGKIKFNNSGQSKDSSIWAFRIN